MRLPDQIRDPRAQATGLLAAAVLISAVAWQVQSSAADDLDRAHSVQQREAPQSDAPAPETDEYRDVLETIERSVVIRREIDALLSRIEATIASFERQQDTAKQITSAALEDLEEIGSSLSSSIDAARSSNSELATLQDRLSRAAQLARRIAKELEELDESLGPSVGGPR